MKTATQKLHDAVEHVNKHHPLPRCEHDNCLQDHSGEQLEPPCGCRLTTPQETPARQGLVEQVTKMLATEAYHYCADCHGHCRQLILTVEALKESVRVNRDPAFQKLCDALANMCDEFYPHQCKYHGPAICDRCEALRQASEALRLAREGEK